MKKHFLRNRQSYSDESLFLSLSLSFLSPLSLSFSSFTLSNLSYKCYMLYLLSDQFVVVEINKLWQSFVYTLLHLQYLSVPLLAVLSPALTKLLSSNCLINTKNLSSAFCPLLCKIGDIILWCTPSTDTLLTRNDSDECGGEARGTLS